MKYSPLDIKNQEFNKSVRGYNTDEVQIYLESLSDFLEELSNENEKLQKDLEVTKKQLDEYKKIERELQSTLLNAQESSSKSVETTKKQTELLLKESELKASQIVEKAKEEANFIRNSVLNLKEERILFIAKLKAMVESQKKILNMNSEKDGEESSKESNKDKPQGGIDVDDILDKIL
jgi:cell division initiation protein